MTNSSLIKVILIIGFILGLGLFATYGPTRSVLIYSSVYCLIAINEIVHSLMRQIHRKRMFTKAQARAKELNKPLMVIGDPNNGDSSKLLGARYGCGDVCVDLTGCPQCPNTIKAKLPNGLEGTEDNSHVVFLSYVLEYVDDYKNAIEEIKRVGGENVYALTLSPYQLTAYLYKGSKNVFFKNPFSIKKRQFG